MRVHARYELIRLQVHRIRYLVADVCFLTVDYRVAGRRRSRLLCRLLGGFLCRRFCGRHSRSFGRFLGWRLGRLGRVCGSLDDLRFVGQGIVLERLVLVRGIKFHRKNLRDCCFYLRCSRADNVKRQGDKHGFLREELIALVGIRTVEVNRACAVHRVEIKHRAACGKHRDNLCLFRVERRL